MFQLLQNIESVYKMLLHNLFCYIWISYAFCIILRHFDSVRYATRKRKKVIRRSIESRYVSREVKVNDTSVSDKSIAIRRTSLIANKTQYFRHVGLTVCVFYAWWFEILQTMSEPSRNSKEKTLRVLRSASSLFFARKASCPTNTILR